MHFSFIQNVQIRFYLSLKALRAKNDCVNYLSNQIVRKIEIFEVYKTSQNVKKRNLANLFFDLKQHFSFDFAQFSG